MRQSDSDVTEDRIGIDASEANYIAPIPSDIMERIGRDGCIVGRRVA